MARERFDPLAPDPAGLAAAVAVLRRGGVVAYPTDTLYGLAVDPRNDAAVERLFAVKGRGAASAIALIAAERRWRNRLRPTVSVRSSGGSRRRSGRDR